MTDKNNAAQPVLTDDEILRRWDIYVSEPSATYPLTNADKIAFARAIESALLSKLRAEGVQAGDDRAEFVAWLTGSYPNTYSEPDAVRFWHQGHVSALAWKAGRAALASAPEAGERNTLMRAIVKAGQDAGIIRADLEAVSGPECLHILECLSKASAPVAEPETMEEIHRRERERAPWVLPKDPTLPDSAPVAGEAQREQGDPASPKDDSDRTYDRPIGYLPAYELGRLHSGHGANLRSAKFGPSALDGDVPVYLEPPKPDAAPQASEAVRNDGFSDGVITALEVMTSHGDWGSTAYCELLQAAGLEAVVRRAINEETWETAGLDRTPMAVECRAALSPTQPTEQGERDA